MNKTLCIMALIILYAPHNHPKLVVGDPNAADGTTFSFNVGFAHFEDRQENSPARWWTATNDPAITGLPDETKQYGLSIVVQAASYIDPKYSIQAVPMTNKEDATIYSFNGTTVSSSSAPSPLWGGVFSNFTVTRQKPVFTLSTSPNLLYSVHNIERHSGNSPDKKPNITQLLVHDFGAGQIIQDIRGYNETIYAAYSNGVFGTGASNIAMIQRSNSTPVNDLPSLPFLQPLATTPFTTTTDAFIGGSGQPALTAFGPSVHLAIAFNSLFVGLQATSATGGVAFGISKVITTSTVVGTTTSYGLEFAQIAPTSVANAGFDTPISAQNGNTISVTHIAGMQTSTNLPYMIVARDNGTAPETIYALPLTPAGAVADFTSVTTNYNFVQRIFTGRYFASNISDAQQINPSNPVVTNQITVGGSSTLPIASTSMLKKMFVVGDCVYAVIGDIATATQLPGTYKSQAIFGADGYIVGWSPWTRVLGSDKQMNYSFVDYKTLTGFYIAAQEPNVSPAFNSLYQTTFDATSNLTPFLKVAQGAAGGLQGLFDFNQTTPGFNNALSLLIGTAYNKITIGQTGLVNAGIFEVKQMNAADVVSWSGQDSDNYQALVAAEIAHNGTNHFIFAGGTSGLWVLTDDTTGVTWSGNLASIAGLSAGQTWKQLGNLGAIKKLVWDQTFLYVLTSDALIQIALDATKFVANPTTPLQANILKTSQDFNGAYLLDLIVDNGYACIGTTNGMYTMQGSAVTPVSLPQGLPAISKIIAVAPNLNPQRSFKTLSNLYVLNNTFGTQQARLHRLVVENGTIQNFPDNVAAQQHSITSGKPSPFIIFDNYISSYFADGSWNIACSYFTGFSQPMDSVATPFVQQIAAGVRSGLSSSQTIMGNYVSYAPLLFIAQGDNILGMVRETTSGALIASGSFEAHTNA